MSSYFHSIVIIFKSFLPFSHCHIFMVKVEDGDSKRSNIKLFPFRHGTPRSALSVRVQRFFKRILRTVAHPSKVRACMLDAHSSNTHTCWSDGWGPPVGHTACLLKTRRTKSRGLMGLKLEVSAWRAPDF